MKAVRALIRVFLYGIFGFCLLTYMFMQGSEYDWMGPDYVIEDNSNDRGPIRFLAVAIALFTQFFIYVSCSRKEAAMTVVLLAVVVGVYW